MGLFEYYLMTEAGMTPAEKNAVDILSKQIATIDKQLNTLIGPTGKGKLMQQQGDMAGHVNDQNPQFKALTARRAMLLAKKIALTNKIADK